MYVWRFVCGDLTTGEVSTTMDTTFYLLLLWSALTLGKLVPGTNRTVGVGEQVSFPCEASHGATYFYRSWLRGYFSRRKKNATKLFHQIGDGDPERLPSGRSDMAVDNASFNMTIGVVQRIDGDVFTCYQYQTTRPLQYFYSYVYIHLKPEDSPLHNSAGLIVGICAGVIVLLLAAGLTVYTLKKWRETDTPVPSVSMGVSYDELLGDRGSVYYNKQD